MRKIKRHSRIEMFGHVEACKAGDHPQKDYCKLHGIAYSTFQLWAKKYRMEHSANKTRTPDFIPVKVQSKPKVILQEPGTNHLHFLYPNGIQVICPERVHPEVIRTLLNPQLCSH